MNDNRQFSRFQYQTLALLENGTTTTTNNLSDGAIAGIVIGTIIGTIVLVFLIFIIYKYRQRLLNIVYKKSKQTDNQNTINNPRSNITYSPEHEYLTVNAITPPK